MNTENKLEIDDFTKALAECINQAQCAVVDPMAHAEIWKEELLELAKGKEPVSEDLEEAVNAYIGYAPEVDESSSTYGKRQAFKAGANWQKEQMMKDADDYIVDDDNTIKRFYDTGGFVGKPIIFGFTPDSINVGDQVKVIVIKQD